jgi:hypothetical protein
MLIWAALINIFASFTIHFGKQKRRDIERCLDMGMSSLRVISQTLNCRIIPLS